VKVPVLIDLIHVTQYPWKAAGSFFYPVLPGVEDSDVGGVRGADVVAC
jgi:hypothetical protein